ncbi:MAG TPA: tetratricopeptide repeat protein [Thermoplasmatales archaeon]|nr:tetratricopeptide repeat protein [Thermoplasmatales archaeon]
MEDHNEAVENFKISARFNRDQLFAYWNLGRLYVLKGDFQQARRYYNTTLSILDKSSHKYKQSMRRFLKEEIRKRETSQVSVPITSPRDILTKCSHM